MRRSFCLLAVLGMGLVTPSIGQTNGGESAAVENLLKQQDAADAAKIDTVLHWPASNFMTAKPTTRPDLRSGIYNISPLNNDSLYVYLSFGDTLNGKEIAEIALYGVRFNRFPCIHQKLCDGKPCGFEHLEGDLEPLPETPTWELYVYEIAEKRPEDLTDYRKIQQWAWKAQRSLLALPLEYKFNSMKFGAIERYGITFRPGFELGGKSYLFLVKRPFYNIRSARDIESRPSAFAQFMITARKADPNNKNLLAQAAATNGAAPAQAWGSWVSWLVAGFVILSVITIWGIAYKRKAKKA